MRAQWALFLFIFREEARTRGTHEPLWRPSARAARRAIRRRAIRRTADHAQLSSRVSTSAARPANRPVAAALWPARRLSASWAVRSLLTAPVRPARSTWAIFSAAARAARTLFPATVWAAWPILSATPGAAGPAQALASLALDHAGDRARGWSAARWRRLLRVHELHRAGDRRGKYCGYLKAQNYDSAYGMLSSKLKGAVHRRSSSARPAPRWITPRAM